MMTIDEPSWDDDRDKLDWQTKQLEQKAVYEEAAVKHVLVRLGLSESSKAMKYELQEAGIEKLTFDFFHSKYPSFPVRFGVGRLWGLTDIDLADLFKRFTATPLFYAHKELREEHGDASLAMLFNWPRLAKFVVLHDCYRDMSIRAPVFLRPVGRTPPTIFAIELLDSFLEGLPAVADYR